MRARISKAFGEKVVFTDLEMEILDGEVTCVLGASGVGKTTLLRILGGLEDYEGEIEGAWKKCAFVFQEPRLLPHLSVADNLRYVGGKEERIEKALADAEILPLKEARAARLSGGEKQRVAFARAFAVDADTLLLDEPFASLDTPLKIRLWQTFARLWQAERRTTVLVTHDLEEAWALGQRILLLDGGKITLDIRPRKGEYPTPYGEDSEEKRAFFRTVLGE